MRVGSVTCRHSDTMDRGRLPYYFGMKVIWTNDIWEDEVICTYNGR
jgi:hypothetical protein